MTAGARPRVALASRSMRRSCSLVVLGLIACGGPPKKVGGQPSWRSPGPDEPPPPPPAAVPTLTLTPSAPPTAAYNDPPVAVAPITALGDAVRAEIAALAPAGVAPVADGRMFAAASALAAIVPKQGILPYPLVEFALQHHGIIEPSPSMFVLWADAATPGPLVQAMRERLAELLHGDPPARWGVGLATRAEGVAVVVMAQVSMVETQPIPRALPSGGKAPLVGKLRSGVVDPEGFVTGVDGAVRRLALVTAPDGSFRGELACDRVDGVIQVELAGTDRTGLTILANVPVWCGGTPPRSVTASVEPEDAAPVTSVAAAEARLLELLNRDRGLAGLPALVADPAVAAVARAHSEDMARSGFVGHVSPTTGSALDRVTAAGLRTSVVLENIARAYGPVEAQAGLMNSPGHRANALSRVATHVGVGVTLGDEVAGRRELYVTMVFTRVPPTLDPAAARAELLPRFTAGGRLAGADELDAIADEFVAQLARGVPRATARQVVSRRLDALGGRYRQAASVVTAVTDLDQVDAAAIIGDSGADRIGLALAQGDHPDLGPGAYWLVIILASKR